MENINEKLIEIWKNFNAKQKSLILISIVVTLFSVIFLLTIAQETDDYLKEDNNIIGSFNRAEASKASSVLEKEGIGFNLKKEGGNFNLIANSPSKVNKARIVLLTNNIKITPKRGWLLFEDQGLGKTKFENNVRLHRVMEEEIELSLEKMNYIIKAKVKIAIPEKTIFVDKKKEASVSALLTISDESRFSKKQIKGIQTFISYSLPNISPNNVKLLNQFGELLEISKDSQEIEKADKQRKFKALSEKDLEEKIIEVISPIVGGIHNLKARVNLDFEFVQKSHSSETFSPEGVLRSSQSFAKQAKTTSSNKEGSVPGVKSNLQEQDINGKKASPINSSKEEKEVNNYEISKEVSSSKDDTFAKILKIGVSVSFNTSNFKDEKKKNEIEKKVISLTKSIVKYNEERGDTVEVAGFDFFFSNEIQDDSNQVKEYYETSLKYFSDFSTLFQWLLAFFLIRLFYKKFIDKAERIHILNQEVDIETDSDLIKKKRERERKRQEFESEIEMSKQRRETNKIKLQQEISEELVEMSKGNEKEELERTEIIKSLNKMCQNKEDEIARVLSKLLTSSGEI